MRHSDVLQREYARMIKTGEGPYQANRRAMKALDILQDGESGLDEVEAVLKGLDLLSGDIVRLRDAANKVRKQSIALLRKA